MEPIVFRPFFRPQIWGGRRLADYLNKLLPPDGRYGESWEISGHPLHVSVVAQGPWAGTALTDLWRRHAKEIWGDSSPTPEAFPWLVKFLDCEDFLSVQVHPNDAAAAQFCPGEQGKNEAWVVVHAEPEAVLYTGLLPGIDAAALRQALDEGAVERCLYGFHPRPGDCVFLQAGTVHAAGGGVLLAEIQQPSDATLRLFDWNRIGPDGRPRVLHRESGLAAVDWTLGPRQPHKDEGCEPGHAVLLDCPLFRIHRIRLPAGESTCLAGFRGGMSVWTVIRGGAGLRTSQGRYRFPLGAAVLVPAACAIEAWENEGREDATVLGYTHPGFRFAP
ncbi:MAG: class I mannose-6-phosphate isomerase [Thermogutta sp.]